MSPEVVDPLSFRRMMGRWPTGVAVVTAREREVDHGLTVNALLSVTLAPPTVLVSLGVDADTTPVVERSGRFAASFLSSAQRPLSERFARNGPGAEKFRGIELDRTPSGLAILPGAIARFECEVGTVLPGGDHRLVLGEVRWIDLPNDELPLLFHRGGYAEDDRRGGPSAARPPAARASPDTLMKRPPLPAGRCGRTGRPGGSGSRWSAAGRPA